MPMRSYVLNERGYDQQMLSDLTNCQWSGGMKSISLFVSTCLAVFELWELDAFIVFVFGKWTCTCIVFVGEQPKMQPSNPRSSF